MAGRSASGGVKLFCDDTLDKAREVIEAMPDRQREVLSYCVEFQSKNDHLPTVALLRKKMGYKSPNSGQKALVALEKRGLLDRNECGRLRFARLEGVSLGHFVSQGMPTRAVCR